jgi:hypothetical protein
MDRATLDSLTPPCSHGFIMTTNRVLWIVTGTLTLVAAVFGVLAPSIYEGIVDEWLLPGMFTQDLFALFGAVLLLVLAFVAREESIRARIVVAGVLGFFFYAYGIYVIEQVYTWLYFVYLAVLGLSFFTVIYTVVTLDFAAVREMRLPPAVRLVCASYAIFVALMFTFIWTSRLIPLIRTGDRIEFAFSIFIIDLVFIMPAMAIAGIMAIRRRPLGVVGVPALFILGIGILSPLAVAELIKPVLYDTPTIPSELWLYLVLSLVFLVLAATYLAMLKPARATR